MLRAGLVFSVRDDLGFNIVVTSDGCSPDTVSGWAEVPEGAELVAVRSTSGNGVIHSLAFVWAGIPQPGKERIQDMRFLAGSELALRYTYVKDNPTFAAVRIPVLLSPSSSPDSVDLVPCAGSPPALPSPSPVDSAAPKPAAVPGPSGSSPSTPSYAPVPAYGYGPATPTSPPTYTSLPPPPPYYHAPSYAQIPPNPGSPMAPTPPGLEPPAAPDTSAPEPPAAPQPPPPSFPNAPDPPGPLAPEPPSAPEWPTAEPPTPRKVVH